MSGASDTLASLGFPDVLIDSDAPTGDALDLALGYAKRGFHVVPIIPRLKRPPMDAWQNHATNDAAVIKQWWTKRYKGHGVGIAPRELPDGGFLVVIDVDEKPEEGISGLETLRDLEDAYGPLPATPTVHSGSGGIHFYFRSPIEIRNDQSSKVGVGIDVRGVGGQSCAPPTIHKNGQPYTWDTENGSETPLADVPGWLLQMLLPKPKATSTTRSKVWDTFDDTPSARFNRSTTWAELLHADDWKLERTDSKGEEYWIRPGKTEGTSATVNYKGLDCFKVFTTSLDWLPPKMYSRFGYYAARHHGGDWKAAAAVMANPRYYPADVNVNDDTDPAAKVPATRFPVEVWERPTLRHIRQAAQARQISPHALLFHVLARVAAYTPPSYTIPPYRAYAPFSLYVAHIGRSGSGKSITAKTADELIGPPPPGTRSLSLGTGEGFVESFFRKIIETDDKKNKTTTKRQDWHGVLFKLDEGSKLWRILERSGQTGVERLRTAWLGDAEGDANSTAETSRNLEANSYAVGIVFLFQPENLRPIFDDTHGGLPQRFLFCRGGDAYAPDPDELPDFPGPLNWQPLPVIRSGNEFGKHPLTFPPEVGADLRPKIQKQLKREEGVDVGEPDEPEPDPLDEHRNVHRMKIAGLLALLDNQKDVTVDDWELADTLLAYSDTVRNGFVTDYQAEKRRLTKAADLKAAERAVTVETTVQAHARDVAVGAVARKVSRQHPKPVARRELQQAIAGKYRQHVTLDDVIDAATLADLIIKTEDGEYIKGKKK